MRSLVILLLLVPGGCHSLLGIDDFQTQTTDGSIGGIDASTDALADAPSDAFVIDTPPGSPCFGTLAPVCFATLPTGDVTISAALNTDTDAQCQIRTQPGGPDLCAIAGDTVTIGVAGTIVTGSRPLVLVAARYLVVQGVLNASSTLLGPIGAGANVASCQGSAGGNGGLAGAGGGAGGTLGQQGGSGGAGAGALAGVSTLVVAVTAVRGGCAGGRGGIGETGSAPPGGSSGGAVALVAGLGIQISASGGVFASGAGGSSNTQVGSPKRAGGGGGGSGGLIVLDAPSIQMLGTVAANGGGGGGGARDGTASPGADGSTTNYTLPAPGGQENGTGGPGGTGGALAALPANGGAGNSQGAGGGGGAGAGVIWVKGTLNGTRFSPAPSVQ